MGVAFFDEFSLLHFAVGVVVQFWGVSLKAWLVMHVLFELAENTVWGMNAINTGFLGRVWPGGKPKADNLVNRVGDVAFGALGWLVAKKLRSLLAKQ